MREIKLVSRPKGIGDVTLKRKTVARVRYHMRPRRMVDAVCTAEGRVEETTTQVLIDGNIQILEGETSLYSDVRYTLHLEDKRLRSCDFYAEPIDVVAGMYRIEGSGNFRKPYRRQSPT